MRPLLAGLAAALLLAGCTVGSDQDARRPPSEEGAGASTHGGTASASEAATPPPAPHSPACYRLTFDKLARTSNNSDPVTCGTRHDAQTIHVGRLDLTARGRRLAVDSDRVKRRLARVCQTRLAVVVGGTPEQRRLSRFEVVWFSPTPEQVEQGADWFRCDLVALAGGERLHRLPPPGRVEGVLDRPGALATYGLCGTAEPGTAAFERVICARRHSWRAVGTIRLTGGNSYPGTSRVRRAGDESCRDRVRDQAPDPLRFEYGWEWPTREQWRHGQHYGFCWAPS